MFVRGFVSPYLISVLFPAYCLMAVGQTPAVPGHFLSGSTPAVIHAATTRNLGPEDPTKIMEVSLWLNPHNRASLDALAEELYDPNSSHYRNWLKRDDFGRQYAPTDAEAAQVAGYLTNHGLQVTSVGPDNLFVRARASVATVEKAFRVALNRYQIKGDLYRMNAGDPFVEDATAALVASVAGMYEYPLGTSLIAAPYSASSYTSNCFPGTTKESITGAPGNYPYAPISGNKYVSSETGAGCGYTPSQIQSAYNLKALYKEGYDGTGQTIVLLDWCGSPTIRQDANAFSARFGLPPLTASNFRIINYPGPSSCSGVNPQINRDVEWAHAVAPGADIALVVAPSAAPQDVDQAEYYAILAGLGNVISGSYGFQEHYQSSSEVLNMNLLNEIAAVFGISTNFPVGDTPSDDFWWVWAPAITPYATAVGGTTLALNKSNAIEWQTGWGSYTLGLDAADVVTQDGFYVQNANGSTGGPSELFAKPSYQKALSGSVRMAPDIAWLADAFTGGIVEFTPGAVQQPPVLAVYGGTGLACTMFSALWAIANQEAGSPLGQAAPYLYSMPKGIITDMVAINSATNPVSWIYYSNTYGFQWLFGESEAYDAIWNQSGIVNLTIMGNNLFAGPPGPGWDYITGLGAPNPKTFADYFNSAK